MALANKFADQRRGSRHARGYGKEWDKLRPLVLARDAGICQVCLAAGVITAGCNIVDHIINKADKGTDDPSNLRCICAPCHKAKTSGEALRGRTGQQPEQLVSSDGPAPGALRVGWLRI